MITVNGNKVSDADNLKLIEFLIRENFNTKMIAVECNGSIIPKTSYDKKILKDGDHLEVVSFVGGG
ncbi:sulfur carrier protein ThiS [uncultured Clostridium sp.]|uniref:sulfur carrier protein ThiS n=1 Tax=uncultured Clostridium sp. TaxID=59620 RepID=UPI0025FFE1BE|nr:sulfur carrier protein ThiS [uncultured Clostridium sp.]